MRLPVVGMFDSVFFQFGLVLHSIVRQAICWSVVSVVSEEYPRKERRKDRWGKKRALCRMSSSVRKNLLRRICTPSPMIGFSSFYHANIL